MKCPDCRNFFRKVTFKRLLTQTPLSIRGSVQYSTAISEPLVIVEQGVLKGTIGTDYDNNKFYKFLGIPYAKSPIGELRFKVEWF